MDYCFIRCQAIAASSRQEMLDGSAYLVVPVVPIVAGVLNENLVPVDEIAACVASWNDLPLPINHPRNAYGDEVSAKTPGRLGESVGRFFSATMDGDRLKGELWLHVDKCRAMGGDALACLERLERHERLEVSTGFWHTIDETPGVFNGKPYRAILRNIRPDHLALLPFDIGACSWADGCGAPRTHAAQPCTSCPACRGEHTWMRVHALETARRPVYQGIDRGTWTAPTFADYVAALDTSATPATTVADASMTLKTKIARSSLLGDPGADTLRDLTLFAVVDPATGKLFENALRAVLSGRGAAADISTKALDSARTMARTLLNEEFGTNLFDTNFKTHKKGTRMAKGTTKHKQLMAALWGMVSKGAEKASLATHLTQEDIEDALGALLAERLSPPPWMDCDDLVEDVQDNYVIYEQNECYYRQEFAIDTAGVVTFVGSPEEVQRNTSYIPVVAGAVIATQRRLPIRRVRPHPQQGERSVEKNDLVHKLITHQATTWSEADTATLGTFSDEQLTRLCTEADARGTVTPISGHALLEPVVTLPALQAMLATVLEERDKSLDGRFAAFVQATAVQAERTRLAEVLQAQGWGESELTGMSLEGMKKLAQTIAPVSYAGMGFPAFPQEGQRLPDDEPKWS